LSDLVTQVDAASRCGVSHDAVGHAKITCTFRRNKFLRRGAFRRVVRRLKAKFMREMDRWERLEGIAFLKRVGVREGDTVVDFGARVGHYSIPAAAIVGPKGKVYAFDKNAAALTELRERSPESITGRIATVHTTGETELDRPDESVDVCLFYDILHMLPATSRRALYKEAHRVLTDRGILSVYPKHVAEDDAADHFKDMTAKEVSREIRASGFSLRDKIRGRLSHDDALVSGCVWNFVKSNRLLQQ
jgi:ubiquinone/menaquinone biosynthesis C-methylase UbiE